MIIPYGEERRNRSRDERLSIEQGGAFAKLRVQRRTSFKGRAKPQRRGNRLGGPTDTRRSLLFCPLVERTNSYCLLCAGH